MPGWFPRVVALAALALAGRAHASGGLGLGSLQRTLLAQCTDAGGPGTPCTDYTCCLNPYYCDGTKCCAYIGTGTCTQDVDCCQNYGPEACTRTNGRASCCSADGGYCAPGSGSCCPGLSCQLDPTPDAGGYICLGCGLPDQTTCAKGQDCCSGSCKGTAKVCCEALGQPCRDSLDCCGQAGGSGNPALSCSAPDPTSGTRSCCNRIKGTPCSSKADCCSGRCIGNHCG